MVESLLARQQQPNKTAWQERGGVGEEGVKHTGEWKQKGGAAAVDRLQMCLSDKLKERGVFVLQA